MPSADDTLRLLRDAIDQSPDNLPLRQSLISTLLQYGRYEEAETALLDALRQAPQSAELKQTLAETYYQLGKTSQAIVILEGLIDAPQGPAASHVLYARILLQQGDVANAVAQYKLGIELDPDAADDNLANRLGISVESADELFEGRLREIPGEPSHSMDSVVQQSDTRFCDVGGMTELKEEIRLKIIYPIQQPEIYEAYGKPIGGGILMYGPPGCGKTHLARATAGEINASFLSIGISDVLDMWIGSSERNLREVFDNARAHRPCVLFFDEIDALGARRSDMRTSSGRQVINQFLSELDGIDRSNEGILVLAATNTPWHIDPAFRRPGRFDRVLFVPPPDPEARQEILRILLKDKPSDRIDFDRLAKKTDRFSGADLKSVVDRAIEDKIHQAMRTGAPQPLTTRDLLTAIKNVRPSTQEWFSTARNYAIYSNEGGAYDDVIKYLNLGNK